MKEFENWWEKNGEVTCSPAMHFDKKDAEKTWRAVLEWTISRIRNGSISYEQAHIEIEQELKS